MSWTLSSQHRLSGWPNREELDVGTEQELTVAADIPDGGKIRPNQDPRSHRLQQQMLLRDFSSSQGINLHWCCCQHLSLQQ